MGTSEPLVGYTELPPGASGSARDAVSAIGGADILVIGEVVSSQPGRVVGPEDEPGVAFTETEFVIREILAQRGAAAALEVGDVILVETELIPGFEMQVDVGTEILSALWLKRDDESAGRYYRPIHNDAWLSLSPSGALTSLSLDPGEVAREFEELGVTGVRRLARSAGASN
jgi:hypothetical protein